MKFSEIKDKSIEELNELLKEKRMELGELRFKLSNQKLKDVKKIRIAKKEIARILTAINYKIKSKQNKNS